jgi:hypothetical protein
MFHRNTQIVDTTTESLCACCTEVPVDEDGNVLDPLSIKEEKSKIYDLFRFMHKTKTYTKEEGKCWKVSEDKPAATEEDDDKIDDKGIVANERRCQILCDDDEKCMGV